MDQMRDKHGCQAVGEVAGEALILADKLVRNCERFILVGRCPRFTRPVKCQLTLSIANTTVLSECSQTVQVGLNVVL